MISYILIFILAVLLLAAVGYIIYSKVFQSECEVCEECPECPECKQDCPVCKECPKCPECVCPVDTNELKRLKMIIYLLGSNMIPPVRNLYGNYQEQGMSNDTINNMVNEYTKTYTGKSRTGIQNYINELVNEVNTGSKIHWQLAKGKVI